jgi:hypothetical protein
MRMLRCYKSFEETTHTIPFEFHLLPACHCRSGGKRGASADKLRGTNGADFEAKGRIHRVDNGIGCGCFGSSGSSNSESLLLIKGPFIFVFDSEGCSSPKYAISLKLLQAKINKTEGGRHPVVLETSLGDVQYELSFVDAEICSRFVKVVKEQSAYAEKAEIREKLGHGHLLNKRASTRFAEQIASEKVKEAPPKNEPNTDLTLGQNDLNLVAAQM